MRPVASLQEHGPVTALSFTPDSTCVVLGTASNSITLYNVHTNQPAEMPAGLKEALSVKLARIPGSLSGVSFLPQKKVCNLHSHLLFQLYFGP